MDSQATRLPHRTQNGDQTPGAGSSRSRLPPKALQPESPRSNLPEPQVQATTRPGQEVELGVFLTPGYAHPNSLPGSPLNNDHFARRGSNGSSMCTLMDAL